MNPFGESSSSLSSLSASFSPLRSVVRRSRVPRRKYEARSKKIDGFSTEIRMIDSQASR